MTDKPKRIFSFFMPKKNEGEMQKPEEKEEKINAEDSVVEIEGKQIPLSEIIKTWQAEQAEIAKKEELSKNALSPEDEVEIDGKKVLVSELMSCYSKKNAEPPTDVKAEEVVDENLQKKNADEKEEEKKETKENAKKNFNKLQNAISKAGVEFKVMVNTREDRIKDGKNKYGSVKGDK
jgi:hypothetical protein